MTPQALAALVRRHVIAVAMVFVLAAGLGYRLMHTVPGYADTATVAFIAPSQSGQLNDDAQTLLVIDALTADSVMSAAGQQQVRSAGGTATYDVALVNLNDEDFPLYGRPYVNVTTTADNAVATQDTFSAVMRVLQNDLAELQARQGAKPDTWIQTRTIAASDGAIPQTGSRKRMLAGLAVLAIIAAFMLARLLDQHPVRLRGRLQLKNRKVAAAREWAGMPASPGAD